MKLSIRLAAILLVISVLCSLAVLAGNTDRIGTAGGQELLIPVGARGIGLNGSHQSFATGIDAIYYNPAGLCRSNNGVDASFSAMSYIADIGVDYAAIAAKAGSIGTFAFSLKSLSFGDIPVTTVDFTDGTGQHYSPGFINLGLTYSRLLNDRISVGTTVTIVNESIMSTSASTVCFNVGVQYIGFVLPGLSLGITVKNVGGELKFAGSDLNVTATVPDARRPAQFYKVDAAPAELPTSFEIGLGYQVKLDEKNSVSLGGDFQNNNYSADEYRLGGEYVFNNLFVARIGYCFSPEAPKDETGASSYIYGLTFGFGLIVDLGGVNAQIDYGYRSVKYFDANNVFTITLGF